MKTHITKSLVAAFALALVTNLHAQTPAAPAPPAPPAARDPFAAGKATAPAPLPVTEAQDENTEYVVVSLTYEAFSLPIAKAGELQRKGISDPELYKEIVTTGKLERMLVLRTKSGQRAMLGNTTLYKFPSEFVPPRRPVDSAAKGGEQERKDPVVTLPIAPTVFDKTEVGDMFEVEPTIGPDGKTLDLQFVVTHTALARRDKWGQGLAEIEQPQFESQKLTTNVAIAFGSQRFIGTLSPVFGNGITQRAEQNVWFCFLTANGVLVSSGVLTGNKPAH